MKKLIFVFLILSFMLIFLVGCDANESFIDSDRFFTVNKGAMYVIVADRETRVMYLFYTGLYQGGVCPMYNSDGSLLLYYGDFS